MKLRNIFDWVIAIYICTISSLYSLMHLFVISSTDQLCFDNTTMNFVPLYHIAPTKPQCAPAGALYTMTKTYSFTFASDQ